MCAKCKIIYTEPDMADRCCDLRKCETCGKPTYSQHYALCAFCQEKKVEVERFAKAEKLTPDQWTGYVYDGKDYYADISDMRGYFSENALPDYVWTCTSKHFVQVSIDDITSSLEDEAYEDFDSDDLNGWPELKIALDAFNEANKDQISYTPDYTKAVVLRAEALAKHDQLVKGQP